MSHPSVLVVDDHALNRKLAQTLFSVEGWDVRVACDAESALDEVAREVPQAILCDVQMPGMDGLALTERLRADTRTAGVVVIALTACATDADRERALQAGCDAWVPKPYDTSALLDQVAELVARRP